MLAPSQITNREVRPMAPVLVIDDEAGLRAFLRLALERSGHEVAEAEDGEVALRAWRAAPYDLILCDLMMPNRDGMETILALRVERPGLPVIAMSGRFPRRAR